MKTKLLTAMCAMVFALVGLMEIRPGTHEAQAKPRVRRLAQVDAPKPQAEPVVSEADLAAMLQGNDAFAVRLLGMLRDNGQNLFFSPFSIRTAFAMMAAGAKGETLETLLAGLDLRLGAEQVHRAMGTWLARLRPADSTVYKLNVANSLWGQKGYGFLEPFIRTLKASYGAEVRDVDFEQASEQARLEINDWVENATSGLIKDLIPKGGVTTDTRMVLVNAVYFKGSWVRAFDKALTQPRPFLLSAGGEVQVPMMRRDGDSERVAIGKGLKMLRLGYKGDKIVMDILLPDAKDGLRKLLDDLSPERLAELDGRLRNRDANIQIPKFTMRWGTSEITPKLIELGLGDVFKNADFSGVAKEGAAITAVFHQAFVDVNEEGTEAAAATAIVAEAGCAMEPEPPLEFVADHPFLFLIREAQSGAILFMGIVENPSA